MQRPSLTGRRQKLPAIVARWEFLNKGSKGDNLYYGLPLDAPIALSAGPSCRCCFPIQMIWESAGSIYDIDNNHESAASHGGGTNGTTGRRTS